MPEGEVPNYTYVQYSVKGVAWAANRRHALRESRQRSLSADLHFAPRAVQKSLVAKFEVQCAVRFRSSDFCADFAPTFQIPKVDFSYLRKSGLSRRCPLFLLETTGSSFAPGYPAYAQKSCVFP
jgi:hypothetical protein